MSLYGVEPLVPAYGRDYKSIKAVQADFDADKDFQTPSGQYINKSQLVEMKVARIQVRYDRIRKTNMLKVS